MRFPLRSARSFQRNNALCAAFLCVPSPYLVPRTHLQRMFKLIVRSSYACAVGRGTRAPASWVPSKMRYTAKHSLPPASNNIYWANVIVVLNGSALYKRGTCRTLNAALCFQSGMHRLPLASPKHAGGGERPHHIIFCPFQVLLHIYISREGLAARVSSTNYRAAAS